MYVSRFLCIYVCLPVCSCCSILFILVFEMDDFLSAVSCVPELARCSIAHSLRSNASLLGRSFLYNKAHYTLEGGASRPVFFSLIPSSFLYSHPFLLRSPSPRLPPTISHRVTMVLPSWFPGQSTQQIRALATPVRAPKQEMPSQAHPPNGSPLSIKVSLSGSGAASVMTSFAALLGQLVTGGGSTTNASGSLAGSQVPSEILPSGGQNNPPIDLHITIEDQSVSAQNKSL